MVNKLFSMLMIGAIAMGCGSSSDGAGGQAGEGGIGGQAGMGGQGGAGGT